jgi:2-iminobutanoate/2-iminopropanoate deaminase
MKKSLIVAMLLIGAVWAEPKEVISTPDAPHPVGPYSQAIKKGDWLFMSGQIGDKTESLEEQTRHALRNLKAVLAANDMTMDQVVNVTCYLTNIDDFDRMNAVYAEFFPTAPPARNTVQVARLPDGVSVEFTAIAVR